MRSPACGFLDFGFLGGGEEGGGEEETEEGLRRWSPMRFLYRTGILSLFFDRASPDEPWLRLLLGVPAWAAGMRALDQN